MSATNNRKFSSRRPRVNFFSSSNLPPFFLQRRFRKLRLARVNRKAFKVIFLLRKKGAKFKALTRFNSSHFFTSRQKLTNLVVDANIKHFENKKRNPKTKVKFFPFSGIYSTFGSFRHKRFFRRRSVFRFYNYNLHPTNSDPVLSFFNLYRSSVYHVHIFQTKNNLFFLLKLNSGRLIFVYSNGQTFYKGSKRSTPAAAELAGKNLSKLVYMNKIKSVFLVFHSPLTSMVRSAVKGLSTRLLFSGIKAYNLRSHNGIRQPATRRI